MTDAGHPGDDRAPLSEQDRVIVSLIGHYVECRERGQVACTHGLFAVAAQFGDSAVAKLRTVLKLYEALLAGEDDAP